MTTKKVKPVPDGFHTATPYLIVKGAGKAIDFYKQAFGAEELFRLEMPGGMIGHAEIKIGNSPIMMGDECVEMGYKSPEAIGGTPVSLMLYVENVDAVFQRAVAAGAKVKEAVQDKFYGDRAGTVVDPFGHQWHIATHIEDVSHDEVMQRAMKLFGGDSKDC